jgi:transposase InsO family protein
VIEAWRIDYNTSRPHSNLGGRSPGEYAAELLHVALGCSETT